MNFVFWLLVILALVGIWFLLTPFFRFIGESASNAVTKVNETMFETGEKKESKE